VECFNAVACGLKKCAISILKTMKFLPTYEL
jgi:hypothetical protein